MASLILIGICVAIVLYQLYKYMVYKPPNFPPGPPRIPIFGSYLFLLLLNYRHFQKAADALCKYYKSKIVGLYLGDIPTIIFNDAETVKESLFHLDFDGKPPVYLAALRDTDFEFRGIFFTDGPFWKNQRRFTLRHLRDYGFGRRFEELEIETAEEITNLIDLLKNGPKHEFEKDLIENGNALIPLIFSACPGNTFLKVLTNERNPREKYGDIYKAAESTFVFQHKADAWGRMLSIEPLRFITILFPGLSGYTVLRKSAMGLYDYMKIIIDEQIRTYDPEHERSILDLYIKEMKEAEAKNENSFFYYKQLVMICVDFILPPLTAVPITIAFLIRRLILQPEIMTKIQEEIDDVVGRGRLPSLDDRTNLAYTEASIREIMRHETLVPSGLPHFSLEATSFRGYDIPKGTAIFPQLTGLHNDPTKWKNPEEFRPERLLDMNGKLSLKKDASLPFGAGKRLCAGETFARNMLFLMVSALLQNFNIKAADGIKNIPMETHTGLVTFPPDFRAKFEPR